MSNPIDWRAANDDTKPKRTPNAPCPSCTGRFVDLDWEVVRVRSMAGDTHTEVPGSCTTCGLECTVYAVVQWAKH